MSWVPLQAQSQLISVRIPCTSKIWLMRMWMWWSAPTASLKKKKKSLCYIICLSSARLQVAALLTWSASRTSTLSTPSWTTWSWSARSTAHWLARERTLSSPKVQKLGNITSVFSYTIITDDGIINVKVTSKTCQFSFNTDASLFCWIMSSVFH